MKLLLLLIPLSLASPPLIQIDAPLPPVDEVVAALQSQGALIFTWLGEEYSTALDRLNRRAPYCLEDLSQTVSDWRKMLSMTPLTEWTGCSTN